MNDKITIQDIVELLIEKHSLNKKDAELFVKGMFDLIEEALTSEKYVKVKGLGTFKLTEVESRESVNVNTGERFEIQGHKKISFIPDTVIKDLINKPFAHFETVVLNETTELTDTPMETESEEEDGEESMVEKESIDVSKTPSINETYQETAKDKSEEKENATETPAETTTKAEAFESETASIIAETPDNKEDACEEKAAETPQEEETKIEAYTDKEAETSEVAIEENKETTESFDAPSISTPAEPEKKKTPWAIIIAVILVLCIAGGIYGYMHSTSKSTVQPPTAPVAAKEEMKDSIVSATNDSLATVEKDTLALQSSTTEAAKAITTAQAPTGNAAINKETAKTTLADTVEYDIAGTKTSHILQEGESLIKLSIKFYGSKNLWPYIVRYNKDVIKDADRVPIGTTLRIPELKPKR